MRPSHLILLAVALAVAAVAVACTPEFRPFDEAVQKLERLDPAAALGLLPQAERVVAAAERAGDGAAAELIRALARGIAARLKSIAGGAPPSADVKDKQFERDLGRLEGLLAE